MKRKVDLRNISDGRLYTSNDMVKADCQDCKGCSACCKGMGESIILDPMDVFRLQQGTGMKFQEMLENYVSLQVVDGIVLPHLKMNKEGEGCAFLNEEGRCSIHPFRPGICRLFPLGRVYDEEGFHYFLQIHECKKKDRTKIKVKKWLNIEDVDAYEKYILAWHKFLVLCQDSMQVLEEDNKRILSLYILKLFYQTDYTSKRDLEFYEEFNQRIQIAFETLNL